MFFSRYDWGATFTPICIFQTNKYISDELHKQAQELRNIQTAITFSIMPLVVRHNTKLTQLTYKELILINNHYKVFFFLALH